MESKPKPIGRVLEIDENTRKLFRERREQRQAELKAKIAAQRLERESAKNNTATRKNEISKVVPEIKKVQPIKKVPDVKKNPPVYKRIIQTNLNLSSKIKQTKASQLRMKKNNPLFGIDIATINKILENDKPKETDTEKKKITKPPLRRSISSVHTKRLNPTLAEQCIHKRLSKSRSEENITQSPKMHFQSPIPEEPLISRTEQRVAFNTPIRKSVHFNVGQTPAPSELRDRLIKWLKTHGKSLNSYQNLRNFGVHQRTPYRPSRKSKFEASVDEEDKENREDLAVPSTSTESIPKVIDYSNMTTNEELFGTPVNHNNTNGIADMNKMAQDALCDVHSLILENYPQDQCLEWLTALKKKFPELQEHPQYWECCAALGEINGEFAEAVDCYKQAIIKGAQVSKIDHSLEKLMETFSFLELDPSKRDSDKKKKRSKTVLDAHNIFKTSVIKFAVREREYRLKAPANMQPLTPLIAQPVRRSTRLSVSNSTPKPTREFMSIKQIEHSFNRSVDFKKNTHLCD